MGANVGLLNGGNTRRTPVQKYKKRPREVVFSAEVGKPVPAIEQPTTQGVGAWYPLNGLGMKSVFPARQKALARAGHGTAITVQSHPPPHKF